MTAPRKCIHASSLQIRAARAIIDISRDHLAVKAGVNERAVRSAERIGCERRTLAREKIIKALARLGCDPCTIIIGAVEPVAAKAPIVEPAQAVIPKRVSAVRMEPARKTAPAKVPAKMTAGAPRSATKSKTVPVLRPAVKMAAPQPPKAGAARAVAASEARQAKPVSFPQPAPIATWQDDRAAIARAVLEAKQRWLARTGPRAEEALAYLRLVEIGAAPWDARRV